MVASDMFRQGMRRLPGCVNIVTTVNQQEPVGCTASAVCSVSASPPSLLVCLNESSQTAWVIQRCQKFCVSICSRSDAELSELFAGNIDEDKFDPDIWEETPSGVLRLTTSPAAFECKLGEAIKFGTHFILIGEITNVHLAENDKDALVYADGTYGVFTGLD